MTRGMRTSHADTGPTICSVEARIEQLELAQPVQLARRTVTQRAWLVVVVRTRDGREGLGFTFGGYDSGEPLVAMINECFAPSIIGESSLATDRLWSAMLRQTLGDERRAQMMRALSAIDIALWDRNARAAAMPLSRYIGVCRPAELPVYVGSGYYSADPDESCAEVARLAMQGFTAIKVKVGRLSPDDEAKRVCAFRAAAGSHVELSADANGAWSDAAVAARNICALSEARIALIEDPLPASDIAAHCELRRLSAVPISAGELYSSAEEHECALTACALDVGQVDATACGGVTAFRRIAALYEAAGVELETHWFPELHAHLAITTPMCRRVEVFSDTRIVNFGLLVTSDAVVGTETVAAGSTPGHGISLVSP